ncbi:MAG: hypothetical protein ACKVVP_20055 [Chloroflexota bacterium]
MSVIVAGPFDITTKYLIQRFPLAWLDLIGHTSPGLVDVLDTDLSSVAAQADKVLRVTEPAPHLVHIVSVQKSGGDFGW